MSINLPQPIAAYFAADRLDADALVQCFVEGAVVKDEGKTYTGLNAIRKWKSGVAAKFTYTTDPLESEQKNGTTVVTCRLNGNFPGSPVNLRFFFGLERDKIAFLEVIP